jgi:hypothetical protein
MLWFWVVLAVVVLAGFTWAGRRQRRHAGDYTLEQSRRDADKYAGDGGGGGNVLG